jgi:hypothetical protein
MDSYKKLRDSIEKFHNLKLLAHNYNSNLNRSNIDDDQEIANRLFTKTCLTVDSISRILPSDQVFSLFNLSSLWIFGRILLEEEVTLKYLFDEGVDLEEKNFRLMLYRYHGVVENHELLKTINTEGIFKEELFEIKQQRERVFKQLIEDIDCYKTGIENHNFISKIPQDRDHYRRSEIINGKTSRYIKFEKLVRIQSKISQSFATYKLGSSFIHSSFFSLNQIFNSEQNVRKLEYEDLLVAINFMRMCLGDIIKLYGHIFKIPIDYKSLSFNTFDD